MRVQLQINVDRELFGILSSIRSSARPTSDDGTEAFDDASQRSECGVDDGGTGGEDSCFPVTDDRVAAGVATLKSRG